jgi:hypothetical protein
MTLVQTVTVRQIQLCTCCQTEIDADMDAYTSGPQVRILMRCCPSCATQLVDDDEVLAATKRFIALNTES